MFGTKLSAPFDEIPAFHCGMLSKGCTVFLRLCCVYLLICVCVCVCLCLISIRVFVLYLFIDRKQMNAYA